MNFVKVNGIEIDGLVFGDVGLMCFGFGWFFIEKKLIINIFSN